MYPFPEKERKYKISLTVFVSYVCMAKLKIFLENGFKILINF